jgi:hypothetical protein
MGSDKMDFVNNHRSTRHWSAKDGLIKDRITMQKFTTLRTTLLKVGAWSVITVVGGNIGALSTASAQSDPVLTTVSAVEEQAPAAEPRATKEPVFRVSKLNREKAPTESLQGSASDRKVQVPAQTAELASSPSAAETTPFRTASSATFPVPQPLVKPSATPASESLASKSLSSAPHPLDRAINIAESALENIRANVRDYSAIMVKRERINGVLGCPQYMQMKVRCPRTISGEQVPFSVYLKTLKPKKAAGREVVWVEGHNDNKLCAHETGLLGMKRFYLDPTGWVAMQNNRYPIHDAGIENLIIKLIERAESAKVAGRAVVNYRDNAEIMKRKCSLIELLNEEQNEQDEFYKAHVFVDKDLNLPVRYVAFDWPKTPGGKPEIIEEYTYVRINLNPGFQDADFSADNPDYKFPRR